MEDSEADEVRRCLVGKVPAAEPFMHAPIEAVRLTVRRWRVTGVLNGWLPGRDIDRPSSTCRHVRARHRRACPWGC